MTEKPLPASDKKLDKAREKGDDPQSLEVYDLIGVLVFALVTSMLADRVMAYCRYFFSFAFVESEVKAERLFFGALTTALQEIGIALVAGCATVGLLGYVANRRRLPTGHGLKFSYDPLRALANRFNPGEIIKTLKLWALTAAALIGCVWTAVSLIPSAVRSFGCSVGCSAVLTLDLLYKLPLFALVPMALGALIDITKNNHQFHKSNRMDHQEAKDESKEENGNMEMKAKIKAFANEQ